MDKDREKGGESITGKVKNNFNSNHKRCKEETMKKMIYPVLLGAFIFPAFSQASDYPNKAY